MSVLFTCDLCGDEIDSGYWARIRIDGHGIDLETGTDRSLGETRHYHAGREGSCYRKAFDALLLTEEWGSTLETIPTASGQSIAAKRRKHTKQGNHPGEQGD